MTTFKLNCAIEASYSVILKFQSFQISFLIPPSKVPGRLGLLITLSLAIFNTLNSVSSKVPRTNSNPTALVRWIIGCLVFIFCAILEYAWILYRKFHHNNKVDGVKQKENQTHSLDRWMCIIFPPICKSLIIMLPDYI